MLTVIWALGFLGAAAALALFGGGVFLGMWLREEETYQKRRERRQAQRQREKERHRQRQEQRQELEQRQEQRQELEQAAFRTLQNYSAETAYGLNQPPMV